MSLPKPPPAQKMTRGMAQDSAIPRGSLNIPMPAGAKPPPPPTAPKPSAGPRK
jgi:hypothetical protein